MIVLLFVWNETGDVLVVGQKGGTIATLLGGGRTGFASVKVSLARGLVNQLGLLTPPVGLGATELESFTNALPRLNFHMVRMKMKWQVLIQQPYRLNSK